MVDKSTGMMGDAVFSSEAFKRQFDKTDPSFHGGDPTPVPLGGNRVPQGMEGPAENEGPAKLEEASLGPSFQSISNLRSLVVKTSTDLNTVHRVMLSIHAEYANSNQVLKDAGEKQPNAATLTSLREDKRKILAALKVHVAEWQEPSLKESYLTGPIGVKAGSTASTVHSSLRQIVSDAEKVCEEDPKEALQHKQFVTSMRPVLQQLTRHRTTLLQVMKDIKKAYSSRPSVCPDGKEKCNGKKSEDTADVLN